jgi:hypothetical protein
MRLPRRPLASLLLLICAAFILAGGFLLRPIANDPRSPALSGKPAPLRETATTPASTNRDSAETPAALPPATISSAVILPAVREKSAQTFFAELSAARAEPELTARHTRILAALTEWATTDVAAAGRWLDKHLEQLPADLALAALFDGAKAQPAEAIALARELSRERPFLTADIGSNLIAALARADEHALAVDFAATGSETHTRDWLAAAFDRWGRADPERALAASSAFEDLARRNQTFQAAALGWAKADPSSLARYAATLPEGDNRTFALLTALRQWAVKDAEAAATFLVQNGPLPGAELILED